MVRERRQVQTVVDAVGAIGGCAEVGAQVVHVVVRHRDGEGGIADLQIQLHRLLVLVVDVLGVGGEAVVDAGKGRGQPGHGGGLGAEVGVQVADALALRLHGQQHGLTDRHPVVLIGQVSQAAELGQGLACLNQQLPVQLRVVELMADAMHGCPHARDGFLEVGLADRAQCKDVDLHAGLFQRQDLVDDEGFRKARIALQHVADGNGRTGLGHGRFLKERRSR